jgi:hypothetical protein
MSRAALTGESTEQVLEQHEWKQRRSAHQARVRAWIDPHHARARRGETHPVYDFLFNYYAYRPTWLLRWHPGLDLTLAGADAIEFLQWKEYRAIDSGVSVCPFALIPRRREFVGWLRQLLSLTTTRPAFFGCFGIHEWAMVYQQERDEVRHNKFPLRFPPAEIAQIVEASGVACTHFDAFRFFTSSARGLNRHQPTRETTRLLEQRGCLHANMDLYKWAFKLAPYSSSELVADCFAFARDIREVDMRASPYDLRALGFEPIPVETAAGRAEYEQLQRIFAARSEPLRARILSVCEGLLMRFGP